MATLMVVMLTTVPALVAAQCAVSDIQVQQNFDVGRFQGKWYISKQYADIPLPEDRYQSREHIYTECAGTHLNTLSIGRDQINDCRYGVGALHRPNLTGTDAAKMRYQPLKTLETMLDYWVVDTDYDNYAVIYGCNSVNEVTGNCDLAYSWILDRYGKPYEYLTTAMLNKINDTIDGLCLQRSNFEVVSQSKERCRQCEQKHWTPQPNFQLDKYMGTWYKVAFIPRKPLPKDYVYNDFVHIYSDMPNNTVSIRLVGRYNEAKGGQCFIKDGLSSLEKTGTPTKFLFYETQDRSISTGDDYWVIETDYTGYAFVLGCVRDATTLYEECNSYSAWVFARKPHLYGDQFLRLNKLFDRYCLYEKDFVTPSHAMGCPKDPADTEKVQVCVKYNKEDVSATNWGII